MSELWHIIDRWVIHFFASTSLVLMLTMLFLWLQRTKRLPVWTRQFAAVFMVAQVPQMLVLAAVLVFAGSTLREAFDVWMGQSLLKAFTDYSSWLAGVATSAWGLYRFWKDSVVPEPF